MTFAARKHNQYIRTIMGADRQGDFGFAPAPKPGIAWISYRRDPGRGRADYQMTIDGKPNGLFICWCGHPTALRPYYVTMPDGTNLDIYKNGSGLGFTTFENLAAAKTAAIEAWRAA